MFRFMISWLMVCSLGTHSVMGCCWHHSHAEPAQEPGADTLQAPHGHLHLGCGGHHTDESSELDPPKCPCDGPQPSSCEELACAYVIVPPTKLPQPQLQAFWALALTAVQFNQTAVCGPSDGRLWETASPPIAGRDCAQAVTQAWLL